MGCIASKGDVLRNALRRRQRGDITFTNANAAVFRVWNVDQSGRALTPGHLQVTSTELVLFQRSKGHSSVVRWPMRCLRRYGFDAELFSFESGRRCPTGPGIYAFKCRRAEALFSLLQEHIQTSGQNGGDDQSHASSGGQQGHRSSTVSETGFNSAGSFLETTTATVVANGNSINNSSSANGVSVNRPSLRGTSLPCSLSSSSTGLLSPTARTPASPHYMNDDLVSRCTSNGPQYVNANETILDAMLTSARGTVVTHQRLPSSPNDNDDNYARLDDLIKQEQCPHFYMNVKPNDVKQTRNGTLTPATLNPQALVPQSSRDRFYANINSSMIGPGGGNNGILAMSPLPATTAHGQVNYVVLDLDGQQQLGGQQPSTPTSPLSLCCSSPPESPMGVVISGSVGGGSVIGGGVVTRGDGYATIDFDKTQALSNSTSGTTELPDESQRKTRHNSNISDLISTRHNSLMSTD